MQKQEVMEIIDLAMQVNTLEERKQSKTGHLPTVFIFYYGNAADLNIRVSETGWCAGQNPDRNFDFYTDEPTDEAYLKRYRRYMQGLIQKNSPQEEATSGSQGE